MNKQSLTVHVPSTAADTEDEWYVAVPWPGIWRITAAYFAPATAVAANDTNYISVALTKNTLAAPTTFASFATAITTQVTGGAAMVIGTQRAFTLTNNDARFFAQGEQVKIAKTDPGSGAILDGTFSFEFERYS